MSDAWNEGYFTDVGYTYGYYREVNPVFQRFCLLLNGLRAALPEAPQDERHCELGFGQGVTVNIHAAANPGLYLATDFNPGHAAHARQLGAASGSGALLLDDSFEQFLDRSDLPQFDSISLHGIWTWVSRENHRIIVEFARRHLKPGGSFFISYNCFPGWSPAYPLRQLFALHDRFGVVPNGAKERVDAALKFSENLLAAQPIYLKAVPHLDKFLKKIAAQNHHYLAHEYFNREWNCMYFTDVVDALAPAKLDYACAAAPLDTVDPLHLAEPARAFLKEIDHPILREQLRDYFVNQQFRKDLYLRGTLRLSEIEQRERLLDTRLVLLQPASQVSLKVAGALGEADLQGDLYKPFIEVLAADGAAPKTLRQLVAALPGHSWAVLRQISAVLAGQGVIAPCQPVEVEQQVGPRCRALNRYLCERARYGQEIQWLASPVTGGGVAASRFQQLFLLAREQGGERPTEWVQCVWQVLAAQSQRIVKGGKTLDTDAENLAELASQAHDFSANRLPLLKVLGIA